jgi:predicted nucleic acid-binding protein
MNDKYFLDTNIIVYSFSQLEPKKSSIARDLLQKSIDNRCGIISTQVVQEFLNVATKKFKKTLDSGASMEFLQSFLMPICDIYPSFELYCSALRIKERYLFSFYDSMIIASGLQANCNILYSEDMKHGQNINGMIIQDPFN